MIERELEDREDPLAFWRGLMVATPICVVFWIAVGAALHFWLRWI